MECKHCFCPDNGTADQTFCHNCGMFIEEWLRTFKGAVPRYCMEEADA